jgi:hypothetical protein
LTSEIGFNLHYHRGKKSRVSLPNMLRSALSMRNTPSGVVSRRQYADPSEDPDFTDKSRR